MNALQLLTALSLAVLVLIAVLTLRDLLRHPDRVRLEINLMFGSLATVIVIQAIARVAGPLPYQVTLLAALALLAQPYLLVRLVRHFMPVPRVLHLAIGTGLAVSCIAVILTPRGTPAAPWLVFLLAGYFFAAEGYATVAFGLGARAMGGLGGKRMGLAALGTGILTGTVLIAIAVSLVPGGSTALAIVSPVLLLLLGGCYYLGFVPPRRLRRAWQMEEMHRFLSDLSRFPVEERGAQAPQQLCQAASRVTGGVCAMVSRWSPEVEGLVIVASDRSDVYPPGGTLNLTGAATGPAWFEQRPIASTAMHRLSPEGQKRMAALQARAILGVPIAIHQRPWGVLTVSLHAPSLFPEEDLDLLQIFTTECATLLEYEELTGQQQALLHRLQETNRELQDASAAKSKFLANMSHELRTPLSAIIGFSELLLDADEWKVAEEARTQYLNHIHDSGQHLLDLINDVLDISKVEAGRMDLQVTSIVPEDAIDDVLQTVRPLALHRNIRLEHSRDAAGSIWADPGRFKQILLNLLSNAIKFTPENGTVTVRAIQAGQDLQVSVADTGIGIAKEDQDRIFEEFLQLESGNGPKPPGTGLGLALTRRLIELHGGGIRLESAPGQGTTFTFTIPMRGPGIGTVTEDRAAEPLPDPAPLPSPVDGRPLVLVVEDDERAATLLQVYLNDAGYAVDLARDGEEALAKARERRPIAITLDLLLPRLDGWEVLRILKEDDAVRDIPVLVVSAVDQKDVGLALGAVDYFVKPVDREALLRRLHQFTFPLGEGTRRVLAVDDDRQFLDLIHGTLEPAGFQVLKALDGSSGINLAQAHHPHLVILDLLMPGMDGFEVIERLKEKPETRDIPVLVISGKDITAEDKVRLNGHILSILRKGAYDRSELLRWLDQINAARGP